MEQPYKGRAIINEEFNGLEVIIPAKKNWLLICFIGGLTFIMLTILLTDEPNMLNVKIFTVLMCIMLKICLWYFKGKEIITIKQEQLIISRKGDIFFRPKTYDLKKVKNLRLMDYTSLNKDFIVPKSDLGIFDFRSAIQFNYENNTIKFAEYLDETESRYIIYKMKNYGIKQESEY